MNAPATIRDVARAAELSVASVSRVLNGHASVHPETRDKVLAAVNALGYVPNAAARSLSTARSHALGVVLPDLHGEFFSELVRGMDRAASARGYLLLLSNMHADLRLAGQALGAMRGRVDGLIVMAPELATAALDTTLPQGLPVVLVNSESAGAHHALRIDNAAGIAAMVRHLVAGGRRRIVHFAGPTDNLDADERRAAYLSTMRECLPGEPARVCEGDFTDASGERLVRELIASGEPFDAICAANDMMALGALQALREAGMRVPEEVAIGGFDDIPLARYLSLSTIGVDMVGIGERAVARLVDEIEAAQGGGDGQLAPPATQRIAPTLIARATTIRA